MRGLAARRPLPYLWSMSFFARFAPLRAINDLRAYLARRRPYEVAFLFVAIAMTSLIVTLIANDSKSIKIPYKRDIIYVEQWRADRSIAEIHAQQKIDGAKKAKEKAELDRLQKKRQAEFKAIDDKLREYGF